MISRTRALFLCNKIPSFVVTFALVYLANIRFFIYKKFMAIRKIYTYEGTFDVEVIYKDIEDAMKHNNPDKFDKVTISSVKFRKALIKKNEDNDERFVSTSIVAE